VSLKGRIEAELGVRTRLRIGSPGSLAVIVNGRQIYSKKKSEHPPAADELIRLVRSELSLGHV
jgi:hypothetical protein